MSNNGISEILQGIAYGMIFVGLMIFLSGCSQKPLVKTEAYKLEPPSALLQPCHETAAPDGQITNRQLLEYAVSLRFDLRECQESKRLLREWVQDAKM